MIERLLPSLRQRVFASLALCALAPLAAVGVANHGMLVKHATESARERDAVLASQIVRQLTALMATVEGNLKSLSGNPILTREGHTEQERMAEIDRLARAGNVYTDLSVYDENGLLIKSSSGDYYDPEEKTQWFHQAKNGKTVVTPPQKVINRPNGMDVSVYFRMSMGGKNETRVIKGRVAFDSILRLLKDASVATGGRQIFLLDPRENYLSHADYDKVMTKLDGWPMTEWQDGTAGLTKDPRTGLSQMWTAVKVPADLTRVGEPWILVMMVPEASTLEAANRAALLQAVTAVIGLALALFLGHWLARLLAYPLVSAAEAADRVKAGDLAARMDADHSVQEMVPLSNAFNSMVREVAMHRSGLEQLVEERTISLQESNQRSEALSAELLASLEATQEGVLLVKLDGTIIAANNRLGGMFGLHPCRMIGASIDSWKVDLFRCFVDPVAFREKWEYALKHHEAATEYEWELLHPSRRIMTSYTSPVVTRKGEIIGQLWMFRDLTKQRELQESLEQAQKMEAIGRLAGGIAHDFNNLLTGIIGNLALSEAMLSQQVGSPEVPHPIDHVRHAKGAASRAAHLVKGLLGFSRRSHLKLGPCGLNDVVREFFPLLRRTIDPRIEILFHPETQLWGLHADPSKLEQILMNLCVNARDAMGAHGQIIISSHNETVSATKAGRYQMPAGDYVRLSVKDNGSGIPEDVIDKIFEPFFTTKEQGKGTGLGLATCYGISQQHGGWIEVESVVNEGTTFHVYLPRQETKAVVQPVAQPVPLKPPAASGHETVLLVDDELVVRLVAETVLRQHGYKIVTASDGAEAVEKFQQNRDDIRLILMDMTMPVLNGPDAFRAIKEIDPSIPALICSGYLVDLGEFETPKGQRPEGFVQKPYDIHEMLSVIRSTLDQRKVAGPEILIEPTVALAG